MLSWPVNIASMIAGAMITCAANPWRTRIGRRCLKLPKPLVWTRIEKYKTPIHITAAMLSHLVIEFGTPPRDNASRAIPTIRIKPRNGLQNATYSDKRLPKMFIEVLLDIVSGSGIVVPGGLETDLTTQPLRVAATLSQKGRQLELR